MQGEVDRDRAGGGEPGARRRWPGRRPGVTATSDGEDGRGEGRQDGERADEAGGGAAEEQAGGGAQEREEGDEDGEGRGGHAVASAFSSAAAGRGVGLRCRRRALRRPGSAVSRSRSTSEVPRLR